MASIGWGAVGSSKEKKKTVNPESWHLGGEAAYQHRG